MMASAPLAAACLAYATDLSRLPSLFCTPITSAVLPPLPAARMASAPSILSFSESVAQPLAICGQAKPWTL